MTIGLVFIFFIAQFFLSNIFAQEEIQDILEGLKKKADEIKSYKIEYEIEIFKAEETFKSIGFVEFKQPGNFFMEIIFPQFEDMEQIFISNNSVIWEYFPAMGIASKINLDKVSKEFKEKYFKNKGNIKTIIENMKQDSIKLVEKVQRENDTIYILEAVPKYDLKKEAVVKISKGRFWMIESKGIPDKVIWYDERDNVVIEQNFNKINLNVEIPDERFSFDPPSDVQVIDITNRIKTAP